MAIPSAIFTNTLCIYYTYDRHGSVLVRGKCTSKHDYLSCALCKNRKNVMSGQFLPVLVLCKLLLAVYLESRRMEVYQLIGHEVVLRLTRRHQASRTVCAGPLPAP